MHCCFFPKYLCPSPNMPYHLNIRHFYFCKTLRIISFIPGGGFPSDRNRKGNSDGQPPIPPAAEGRVVPNLAVTSGHLGTNNYLEHTACLVKSPRLKPGLSDTSSAVSETPGRSGAKFGVSGREYNHTTLLFKYCIFLICLLDEAVWSYC